MKSSAVKCYRSLGTCKSDLRGAFATRNNSEIHKSHYNKGKSDQCVVHLWREDLPKETTAVLRKYDDVFPKDLPPRLPPIRKGHEFKIDLEDDTPPVHRPLYKLSPLELEEVRKQIE